MVVGITPYVIIDVFGYEESFGVQEELGAGGVSPKNVRTPKSKKSTALPFSLKLWNLIISPYTMRSVTKNPSENRRFAVVCR